MNNLRDEGEIKFRLTLKRAPAPEQNQVIAIEKWRALFYRLSLVGEYPTEKIGYGNLSYRLHRNTFVITGSQTGHLPHLQTHHYTKVIECDLKRGSVTAEGLIPPSSESLTHYGIYLANPSIQCIFHVHHQSLRQMLKNRKIDSINEDVAYGSQDMANAVANLLDKKNSGIFLIKGQEDGIISFGMTVEDTGKNILDIYRQLAVRQ